MPIQGTATVDQLKRHANEWLTTKELADRLGVHVDTIRRWERRGRITCVRHPVNNYRLFLWTEIVEELSNNEPRYSPLRSRLV